MQKRLKILYNNIHRAQNPAQDQHFIVAEREGFEPPIPVKVYTLSRRAPSATRPSLRSRSVDDYFSQDSKSVDSSARLLVHAQEARRDPALHLAHDRVRALNAKRRTIPEAIGSGKSGFFSHFEDPDRNPPYLPNSIGAMSSGVKASINMPAERRSEEGTRGSSQKSRCIFPRSVAIFYAVRGAGCGQTKTDRNRKSLFSTRESKPARSCGYGAISPQWTSQPVHAIRAASNCGQVAGS